RRASGGRRRQAHDPVPRSRAQGERRERAAVRRGRDRERRRRPGWDRRIGYGIEVRGDRRRSGRRGTRERKDPQDRREHEQGQRSFGSVHVLSTPWWSPYVASGGQAHPRPRAESSPVGGTASTGQGYSVWT